MIQEVSKTYTWDAAHQLPNHDGKCRNLHGHTYSATVYVTGEVIEWPEGPSDGMVLDYGALDHFVKPIIDSLDHSFMYCGEEAIFKILTPDEARTAFGKLAYIPGRTTAENIATFLVNAVVTELKCERSARLMSVTVRVSETPKTSASCSSQVFHL